MHRGIHRKEVETQRSSETPRLSAIIKGQYICGEVARLKENDTSLLGVVNCGEENI